MRLGIYLHSGNGGSSQLSSFYGLLDILSGTELNAGQREIVQTAKQSCELLLKIIDSILDYSKLEADGKHSSHLTLNSSHTID